MLYLSTRNKADTYTAHRALNEPMAPDGGFYVPFHLPVFTQDERFNIKNLTFCEAIAKVLNLFFGLRLTGWDVECEVGRLPLRLEPVNQRLLFSETWRNPAGSHKYLLRNLYALMTGKKDGNTQPVGWVCIAIEIALLFAAYTTVDVTEEGLDVAVATGDFAEIVAVLYAKQMGLPVNIVVCADNENSICWDLLTKGEYNVNTAVVNTVLPQMDIAQPKYLEYFVYMRLGIRETIRFVEDSEQKKIYRVDEEQLPMLAEGLFAAVVSANRVDPILSGMYRANGYTIDPVTALAYGGLQDYRSHTGVNRDTLILAKQRPNKEME